MTIKDYNRITGNKDYSDTTMSLGFRRYFMLPIKVKKNIVVKYMLETKTEDKRCSFDILNDSEAYIKKFLSELTEQEYKNWIISN